MSALQCLRRTTLNLRAVLPAARTYSSNPPAAIPNPEPSLTAPLTPGPIKPGSEAEVVRSGTLVGTKLTNINYLKNKADPVALEDSQYPEWLWAALESSKASSAGPSEDVGDLYCTLSGCCEAMWR